MQLMECGVEVRQKHKRGIFSRESACVLRVNKDRDQIEINQHKRIRQICKTIPAHQIENIGYSANKPTELVVQSKDKSNDLIFKLPTENANKVFATRLANHFVKPPVESESGTFNRQNNRTLIASEEKITTSF